MPAKRKNGRGDESVQILRAIWREMKALNGRIDRTREELSSRIDQTNQRLDQTNERLDQTNQRLDQTNERLDQTNQRLDRVEHAVEQLARVQMEGETRVASELVALARAVTETQELLKNRLELRSRLDDHEVRISTIERRLA
jgi:ABC-type transporter Mla subunit MlaD